MGEGLPDHNKFILLWLDQQLGLPWFNSNNDVLRLNGSNFKTYPNTFTDQVTFSSTNKYIKNVTIDIYDVAGNLVKTIY